MLLSVFGTPSPLTYSGCAVVRTIADCAAGSHTFIQAVFLEDVKDAWAKLDRPKTEAVVLFSDFPARPLTELVRGARAPCVVFLDEFEEVVHSALERRGMSIAQSLRFATQVACALDRLQGDQVLLITPKSCERPIRDLIVNACEFFGLRETPKLADNVLARLGYDGSAPTFGEHFAGTRPRLASDASVDAREDPHDRALIRLVSDQYAGIGTGNIPSQIVWPTELFLEWDRPGAFLKGPIELLGPARFIICGPYLHLPEGSWEARVVIEVAENVSGNRLSVDVFSGAILYGATMDLPAFGLFEFVLPFSVPDPFIPTELRFQILRGAIEGLLTLKRVSFTRRRLPLSDSTT